MLTVSEVAWPIKRNSALISISLDNEKTISSSSITGSPTEANDNLTYRKKKGRYV